MRILCVGDVHARYQDLEDCASLMSYVWEVAGETDPDYVLFMGDQYNDHGVVDIRVQRFWLDQFHNRPQKVAALVGNHDQLGNGLTPHTNAMQVHGHQIQVVGEVKFLGEGVAFAAHGVDLTQLNVTKNIKYLFCHHTFDGAQYENGFYAKGGIDPVKVPADHIVSGHIHTPAMFGKVLYVGSPRWLTASDAEVGSRSLVLVDTDTGICQSFYTNDVCSRIIRIVVTPETGNQPFTADHKDRVLMDIHGPQAFVDEVAASWRGQPNTRVRTFPEQVKVAELKESEGIGQSWGKHCDKYTPPYETPKPVLLEKAKEINV